MGEIQWIPCDLAPGDRRSVHFNWQGFQILRILSLEDPLFNLAYTQLWDEFGKQGEMEKRSVIAERFKWDPSHIASGYSFGYEIIVVLYQGQFAAVRDCTAIVCHAPSPKAIVHLSHVFIDPSFRRNGLIGWLRAWPIQKARACFQAAGLPPKSPVTLVAELEPYMAEKNLRKLDDKKPSIKIIRLKSYENAGFLMVDPLTVPYVQPDFRLPSIIDQEGEAKPLPLRLLVRRVNRETELEMSSTEVKQIISALYQMYGTCFRQKDMTVVWNHFHSAFPKNIQSVRLLKDFGTFQPLTGFGGQ